MIQAILFDMDGVIIDSEHYWLKREYKLIKGLIPNWSADQHKKLMGMSVHNIYDHITERNNLELTREEFIERYNELARIIYCQETKLFPGLLESMSWSKENGLKLALCSSSPRSWINLVIDRFQLKEFFVVIVSPEDIKMKGKPAPDIYRRAISLIKVDKNKCVAIEDSENGVLAAKRAGVYCIGFRNGSNSDQNLEKADDIISSLNDIKSSYIFRN